MIADYQTNTIYVSHWLGEYQSAILREIEAAVIGSETKLNVLPDTQDYWVRDFMPIQIEANKYVQYQFEPDYLKRKAKSKYRTNPNPINDYLGIKVKPSNLVIDGGNIVKHNDTLILTDKVLIENTTHTKESIINQIKSDFEVSKVILIPRDEKCDYGHADGMLRFIDNKTVLISDFYAYLGNTLTKPLLDAGLSIEWLKTGGKSLGGDEVAYINFLQTKDVLLIPQLGKKPQDAFAIEQLQSYFPCYKVKGINTKMITKHFGGALNCMSWTVLE